MRDIIIGIIIGILIILSISNTHIILDNHSEKCLTIVVVTAIISLTVLKLKRGNK